MFKWLKEKAEKAAAKQSLFNVKVNVKTLVSIANRADSRIQISGEPNAADVEKVGKAQSRLLKDVELCIANGLTVAQVQSAITEGLSAETVSPGARMAIDHVINTAS
jgi:predicted Zn-dependent protease